MSSTDAFFVRFGPGYRWLATLTAMVAAAEVVVGLAIITSIFRTRRTASVDDANLLKN